jgi:hypothetical protein
MTDWLTIGQPQVAASALPIQASKVAEVAHRTGWSITDYLRSVSIDPACGQDEGTGASHATAGSLSLAECPFLRIAG